MIDVKELPFHASPATTLGVELEVQIVDRDSGDLVPGAIRLLDACEQEKLENVVPEFLQSMVEVKTGVCTDVDAVRGELFPLLKKVRTLAHSLGYDLALGGTHPFARAAGNAVSPDARYEEIRKRLGWIAYQEATFGMHIHVGVPGGEQAIGLINLLTPYLPHLLALSANSAFWEGIDTQFASCRTVMFRPSPHSGIPPHRETWLDVSEYFKVLRVAGAIEGTKDVYWDIRPRHDFGTIEFRICDAPPTLDIMLGLAALVRTLVEDGIRQLKKSPELGKSTPPQFWLAAENKSLAARYGLKASCTRRPDLPHRTLAEDMVMLLERIKPVAEEIGEAAHLRVFDDLDSYEIGADRQRRLFRQAGDWQAVIADMTTRWAGDLDDGSAPAAAPNAATPALD